MKENINFNRLRKLVNLIVEQEESDDFYRITPEEYLQLLKFSDNSPGVTRIKKFGGKPLYITDSLSVRGLPINSLGNVAYVNGSLDIGDTKISELPDNIAKGNIWDSGTPREDKRLRIQDEKWLADNETKRENDEWKIGNSDEGDKINALFQYLIDEGEIESMDEDERETLNELKRRYARIEKEYQESEDSDEQSELYDKLTDLEGDIEGLEERNNDIYNTIVPDGSYYTGLETFNVIPLRKGSQLRIYTVGTEDEMDDALEKYWENYIDDVGLEGINQYVLENCVDEDAVVEMAEESYREDVEYNPEIYFDNDDLELSPSQERRIEELEGYVNELDDYINEMTDKQSSLEDEIEDSEEYSRSYDEIQELIDEAESNKEKAQEEIDEINDSKEVSESMIDDKVSDLVYDVKRDPLGYLNDHGMSVKYYIDGECIKESLSSNSEYGDMNNYDGSYDTIDIGGGIYYIMRTD
jgi:hypothetical protein